VVRVLALCGLRFGELAALRVGRVDLLRRRMEIAESVTEVNGRAVFGTPKSNLPRSVPIPRSLADDLAQLMAGKGADDFLFTAPGGGVLLLRNFRRRVFDPAAGAAGLDGLTPHELRHTAASLAVSAGANVKAVQRMLGHASAAMTLDVYSACSTTTWTGSRSGSTRPRLNLLRTFCGLTRPSRSSTRAAQPSDLWFYWSG
jgi:integrase